MKSGLRWNRTPFITLWVLVLAVQACGAEGARSSSDDSRAFVPAAESATREAEAPRFRSPELPVQSMAATDLLALLDGDDGPVVLDVRTPEEYRAAHVPGAINIPYDQIAQHLDSLASFRARGLVVYCRTGRRAGDAERVLQDAGFDRLWDLEGHMVGWQAESLPLAGTCC